jgi:hypothetical protein
VAQPMAGNIICRLHLGSNYAWCPDVKRELFSSHLEPHVQADHPIYDGPGKLRVRTFHLLLMTVQRPGRWAYSPMFLNQRDPLHGVVFMLFVKATDVSCKRWQTAQSKYLQGSAFAHKEALTWLLGLPYACLCWHLRVLMHAVAQ